MSEAAVAADDPAGMEFFEKKIRPILVDNCYKCHSQQSQKVKGGLLLDTREGLLKGGDTGPAIKPGDVEQSLLIKAVRYTDDDLQMPPKNKKLSRRTNCQSRSVGQNGRAGSARPASRSRFAGRIHPGKGPHALGFPTSPGTALPGCQK